jgi:hypothetical protein
VDKFAIALVMALLVACASSPGHPTARARRPAVSPTAPIPTPTPTPTSTVPPEVIAADQVRACEIQHGMSSQHVSVKVAPSLSIFENCNWPPPSYADQTGYSEIRVVDTIGVPYGSEAEGDDLADRITSTCSTLRLSYTFASQGGEVHLQPFTAHPGDLMTPYGQQWTGNPSTLTFYPARDEVVVLHNDKDELDEATCMS